MYTYFRVTQKRSPCLTLYQRQKKNAWPNSLNTRKEVVVTILDLPLVWLFPDIVAKTWAQSPYFFIDRAVVFLNLIYGNHKALAYTASFFSQVLTFVVPLQADKYNNFTIILNQTKQTCSTHPMIYQGIFQNTKTFLK